MTVQTLNPNRLATTSPADLPPGVSNIVKWASDLATAAQAVELIVDTPFIPVSFWPLPQGVQIRDFPNPALKHPRETDEEHVRRRRGAIAAAASAVVYGDEIGLTAQAALTSVYVVRGRPGLYAEAMVALVKSHGHELVVEELTDRVCRMRGRRRGEQEWQRFEFSIDRARRSGYDKQNPKYGSDPQAMLYPRCASIACRTIAPDVLKGLAIVEEVLDEPDAAAPAGNGTRTVQRRPVAAVEAPSTRGAVADPVPGAPTTGNPDAGHVKIVDTPQAIDERQWRQINARFVELGVRGEGQAAQRLQVIGHLLGRPVTQGRELASDEAEMVLASLAGGAGERTVEEVLGGGPRAERDAEQPAPPAAGPPLPGEQDRPDPWHINDATGGADPDEDVDDAGDELAVPGDER